jgi:biopolymer transport protein ExbD
MIRRRKRRKMLSVPTASMGDIAFLLIIFFILASRFAQEKVNIESPRSPDISEMEEPKVMVSVTKEGEIYCQGQLMPSAADVRRRIENYLVGKTKPEQKLVTFRCDRTVDRGVFEPVIEAIASAGGIISAMGDMGDDQKRK